MESTEWPEIGIFAGQTHHMGNWPECVSVNAYGMKGQYCMPSATYDFRPEQVNFTIHEIPAEETSAYLAIKMVRTIFEHRFNSELKLVFFNNPKKSYSYLITCFVNGYEFALQREFLKMSSSFSLKSKVPAGNKGPLSKNWSSGFNCCFSDGVLDWMGSVVNTLSEYVLKYFKEWMVIWAETFWTTFLECFEKRKNWVSNDFFRQVPACKIKLNFANKWMRNVELFLTLSSKTRLIRNKHRLLPNST